jgi:cell division protein FtsB
VSYVAIKKQVSNRTSVLQKKAEELKTLKRQVELLSNKSLDLDFLEERCRIVLNYCYPDDLIIKDKAIALLP